MNKTINKRDFLGLALGASTIYVTAGMPTAAMAQTDTIKVGLLLSMTGQLADIGRQILAGVKQYVAEHGDTVAGKKIELILRDDQTAPEVAGRLARELVVNDKVTMLTGFATSPAAIAAAPYSTQSKTPMVIMNAALSSIVSKERPYIVRASLTQPQASVVMADWAFRNDIKKVVTLVSDYGPGIDSEKFFVEGFRAKGGQIIESLRVPMASIDFSPALQKVSDLKPDAVFIFVPGSSSSVPLIKQFMERGLAKAGIKIIAPGDLTDDDQLNNMGDGVIGVITAHHYSADHPSELNRRYVSAFTKANGFRPDFFSVGGYDGMHVIYEAIKATKGTGNSDALLAAMRGMKWESPRGPVFIDPETGDIVQNIYLRRVEKKNGQLWNVEFDVVKDVKDPGKAKQS